MEFVAAKQDGTEIRFKDDKRLLWFSGLSAALISMLTFWFYFASNGNLLSLFFPLIYFFGFIPLLDALIGGDTSNPPEEVVGSMGKDKYYDLVAYAHIPAHFLLFLATVWFVGTQSIPVWGVFVLALGVGLVNANMINVGHELGHKLDKRNRFAAKMALSLSGYGHFTAEHNQGHHVMVSTPEDCASAQMGQSIYAFARRELPGALIGGWRQEARRLKAKGLPFFHWRNDILQVYLLTALISAGLVWAFGWAVLPFILLHHFFSWYGLTLVNYIEHYGLLRQKRENGKYEKCQPRHSWNSNHRVSNLLLLHLQRHSDHHANPMRPYQALRDFEDVPCLPSGYPGCLVLAAIPPFWFKVMDPKVMEWAEGDFDKVNVYPPAREKLRARYAA